MTNEEKLKLKEYLIATAEYYQRGLTPTALVMFVEDLEDLPLESVLMAYKKLRRDPKQKFMPLPAQVRDLLSEEKSEATEADQIAGRIADAVSRFGYTGQDSARKFIGEVGWQVVRGNGGWQELCQMETKELPIRRAQWRNSALAALEMKRKNQQYMPVGLGEGSQHAFNARETHSLEYKPVDVKPVERRRPPSLNELIGAARDRAQKAPEAGEATEKKNTTEEKAE